jgi:nucleotidyltransferase/DNA polymerase involved in DNA repair
MLLLLPPPATQTQLVFVQPNFEKYSAASKQVFELFREIDAAAEGASLDECYIGECCLLRHATGALLSGVSGPVPSLSAAACL